MIPTQPMLPSTKVALAGSAAALGIGAWLGDAPGLGVVGGFAAGAGVALASGLAQRRMAVAKPAWVVHVLGGGFLLKIFALLALTLCVRLVPPLAQGIEWRAFMLSFAAAVLALLPCTAWELLRATRAGVSARARGDSVAYQQGSPS